MTISGFDNVFYSNISFEACIEYFENELSKYWPNFIVDKESMSNSSDNLERHERFYSKNQKMLDFHEEYGFNTKIGKEGCLYLIAVKQPIFDVEILVNKEIEPEGEFAGPDPYDSRMILSGGWQYTLVTPESIAEVGFSREIFERLLFCIKK